ncbi:MAG: TIGR03905 family TSCPD domain-containing protein [Clostridia bacterium]|nr:TIGR03905 family TSCPD domain-containing protein [Clostridia bacterium]
MFQYKTHGTCSQQILIDVNDDDVIENVQFIGGCTGNTQGVSKLVKGMKVDEVIARLKGIQCRAGTSCPDQLAQALEQMKAQRKG